MAYQWWNASSSKVYNNVYCIEGYVRYTKIVSR